MAKLALITILYNSDEVLEDFFKSISIQTFKDYKLYIIDNSSKDSTIREIDRCKNIYPISELVYINSGGNIGVAAGNNIGIKQAIQDNSEHLLILNNDILIEQSFVFERMFQRASKEDLITPKILYYDTRKIWMAGGYLDHFRALGVHYGMKKENNQFKKDSGYVTYSPTCFLWVRAGVFKKIGMMDEKYFAYYDDTDFALRAIRAGFKIWYESDIYLLHKVSSSSGGDDSPFYIYYGNRNKLYYIRKNYKGVSKIFSIVYTIFSRFIFFMKYNKSGKKKLIEAMKDGFKMSVQ